MSIMKLKTTQGETKWEVRVYENGRGSKRISRTFDRKSDAEAFLDGHKRELIERKINPFKSVGFEDRTFREEAENWLLSAEIRFSSGNLLRCQAVVRDLMPKYGDLLVARFTPEVITKFQRDEKIKGLEDATVNRKCQIILAILNYAVKQRRIPFNPAQGYSKLREVQKETEFWSKGEAIQVKSLKNSDG